MPELENDLLNRLMFVLMKQNIPDLDGIRNKFVVILSDYRIEPKEEALVVWTEGKNEYYLKRFILAKAVAGCTKRTLKEYQAALTRTFNDIGKDVDTITSADIQVFFARQLRKGLKNSTVDNYWRDLSSFFGWMHREELIPKNPMNRVDSIKVRTEKKHAFTELEVEQIRNGCRDNRERAIIEMLFSTGCRVTELITIKIADIDGNVIDVLGKGEKHRNVYLNAKALVALQNYLDERADSNPWLFPRRGGEALKRKGRSVAKTQIGWYKDPELVDGSLHCPDSTIESLVRELGRRIGVENVHPHRFRRTCATMALRRGMPIEQVSKMLGHEQLTTTQIYLDLSEEELAQAHSKYVV